MNPQIENKQESINDSIKTNEVDITTGLSILESRCDKWLENKEEYFKYTEFCENVFNVSDENKDNKDYITKIDNNNRDCINIFDQCLINT